MHCSPPGSSVHGILQARILEWVAITLLRGDLPEPGIEPQSPALQANSLLSEPPGNLLLAKSLFTEQFKTRAVEPDRKCFLPTRGHLAVSKTFFIMTTERDATGIYCIG